MQVIETNTLFAQVSGEQSAVVSGGTALEGAYQIAAFFAANTVANGNVILTAGEAITVIAVTLTP